MIAEIKRRSPSKGDLNVGLDPADVAMTYEDGGASCLSVLTDREFFGGSPGDLKAANAVTRLPVLRKDFTVAPHDVCDARLMGADCVLLIVAALSDADLRRFHDLAGEVGLDALVEVHDEPELERALATGATLVGVNQRDLVTFEVDPARAERMAAAIPDGVVKVAESGVRDGDDARRLRDAGYHADPGGRDPRRPRPTLPVRSNCSRGTDALQPRRPTSCPRPGSTCCPGCPSPCSRRCTPAPGSRSAPTTSRRCSPWR